MRERVWREHVRRAPLAAAPSAGVGTVGARARRGRAPGSPLAATTVRNRIVLPKSGAISAGRAVQQLAAGQSGELRQGGASARQGVAIARGGLTKHSPLTLDAGRRATPRATHAPVLSPTRSAARPPCCSYPRMRHRHRPPRVLARSSVDNDRAWMSSGASGGLVAPAPPVPSCLVGRAQRKICRVRPQGTLALEARLSRAAPARGREMWLVSRREQTVHQDRQEHPHCGTQLVTSGKPVLFLQSSQRSSRGPRATAITLCSAQMHGTLGRLVFCLSLVASAEAPRAFRGASARAELSLPPRRTPPRAPTA